MDFIAALEVLPAPLKPRHYGAIEVLLLLLLLLGTQQHNNCLTACYLGQLG